MMLGELGVKAEAAPETPPSLDDVAESRLSAALVMIHFACFHADEINLI